MILKIVNGKNLPIGLDLGSHWVKMAQLRSLEDGYELVAAEAVQLPPAARHDFKNRLDFTCDAIRQMLSCGQFIGRQCILSLPANATLVQHVRIPKVSVEQTAAAVAEELNGKLPYPTEQAVIRHIVVGEVPGDGDTKQEVIAVSVCRPVLESFLDMACRAKLDVIGVNIEACAVVECFSRVFRRASDGVHATLFVDIGAASTQFVLAMGNRVVFARNLAAGGEEIDQALAEQMKITLDAARMLRQEVAGGKSSPQAEEELYRLLDAPVKALADEMTQCLRYYESVFRNQSVERAIFVGGQAYDKRLCQAIAKWLDLPAQIGDPLVRVKRAKGATAHWNFDWRQPQPAWAVAVGLSLGSAIAA
jgi:type IV pilus assembly protein PilM